MPKFIAALIGRFIGRKLKLEDGQMEDNKKWWKSKTIWSGAVAVLLAAYSTAAAQFSLPPVPEWIFALLGAVGIYGRVDAKEKIG